MVWVLYAATIIVGIVVEEAVSGPAANDPWRILVVIVVVGVVVGGTSLVLAGGLGLSFLALVLGGAVWGLVVGWDDRDHYLTPYCSYGARSEAQRDSCLGRVSTEEIDALDTPAARFARGESGCGSGSGPLCAETASLVDG